MTVKELKYYISSLPAEVDDHNVKFVHLDTGYPSEYEINGYFIAMRDEKPVILLTDIGVAPRV